MKTIIRFIITILFFPIFMQAQEEQEINSLFKNAEAQYGMSDFYFYSSNYKGEPIYGGGVNFTAVFNNNLAIGVGVDISETKKVNFQNLTPAIKPKLSIWGFTANMEYLIIPKKIINFSIPLKIGLGYATYNDRYYKDSWGYGNYSNTYKLIEDDFYFIAEPGINMFVNIFDWMSVKAGGSYRFVLGANELGSNIDFSGYTINVGLRFKIFE